MRCKTLLPGTTLESRRGESDAPVRAVRASRGPEILPLIDVQITPLLSDWRNLVRASGMQGLIREIAASSEVVELSADHVLLRPSSQSLVKHEIVQMIEDAVSKGAGRPIAVRFTSDEREHDALTLSLIEEAERRAARKAMIEAFKSDPFVQKCLEVFNGTIDETSIEPIQTKKE